MKLIQEYGVVLKTVAVGEGKELSLLTPTYGRIVVRDYSRQQRDKQGSPGTLARFSLEKKRSEWIARDREDYAYATPIDTHDIYWYHHILELAYYFIPLEKPSLDIFKLLCEQLCLQRKTTALEAKDGYGWQASILLFLQLLGEQIPDDILCWITRYKNGEKNKKLLQTRGEKEYFYQRKLLDTWIVRFIMLHPYYRSMKTSQFFSDLYPYC